MVILGLGTNMGNKLDFLRQGYALLQKIPGLTIQEVSPLYISDALLPDNAPSSWDEPYLNLAIRCETRLDPHVLLQQTKHIEITLGRDITQTWGPRPLDIDILAWDEQILYDDTLHIPHEQLHTRPFALWPLADLVPNWKNPLPNDSQHKTASELAEQWGSRFSGDAPFRTRRILQRIDTPEIVGILNITPNSFSDGGKFCDPALAYAQALQLVQEGASIIDIGAEATGPKAEPLNAEIEWQRLEPVLTLLLAHKKDFLIPPKFSIDTYHPSTAEKALHLGVDWINDPSGLDNPNMIDVLKNHNCDIVIMHHLGIPARSHAILPRDTDIVKTVYQWAEHKLHSLTKHIAPERLIIDVGIGFGKTAEQSLQLIKHLSHFQRLNTRLLIGHSRKSFLNLFTDKQGIERDIETLSISAYLSENKVNYLRLHNAALYARFMLTYQSVKSHY